MSIESVACEPRTPGDTAQEVKMKAKSVLVPVVLLAVVALSGCLAKTGTGTGNNYVNRADTAPEAPAVNTAAQPPKSVAK